jgi:biopolymer transport protein ExbB
VPQAKPAPAAPSTALLPAAESPLPEGVPSGTILGKNLWETFLAGGALMWPILLCSFIGLAFAIERAVSLREKVVIPQGLADNVQAALQERGPGAALRLCNERPSSLSRVLAAGLVVADASREQVVASMEETGERELWRLNRFAKPLNIITGVAPLLGLLGTVQGMIMAFDVVAQKGAMGDPRQLAAGIATALLTTFAGLTVAIPCYCLYHYFRDKSDHMFVEIEEAATHVARILKGTPNHAHPPSSPGG